MIDLEKIRAHKTMYIRIKKDIPILSGLLARRKSVAIYFEQEYHEQINAYFRSHYGEISRRLESNYIQLVYFPAFLEHWEEYIQYNLPNGTEFATRPIAAADFYKTIADNIIKIPPTGRPMLLIPDYKGKDPFPPGMLEEDQIGFFCYDLDYADDSQFNRALNHYLPPLRTGSGDVMFRDGGGKRGGVWWLTEAEQKELLSEADLGDISTISREIQERVDRLYAMGVPEQLLMRMLSLSEPTPSRLLITDDFRILLPDYNNREIKLAKLDKALYFFYLRHAEGVLFKHLCDYRNELLDIYSLISTREDLEGIGRSIDDLVDSTKNSVNEKCSRIKAAFVSQFQDKLARHYYITGRAGYHKRITLDRKLVEDRSGMVM